MVTRSIFRLYLFGLVLLGGFVLLLWRLWVVQVEDHKKYLAQVPQADIVMQRVAAPRGEIKDRNGVPLAVNRMSFEIKLDLREIRRVYVSRHPKDIPKTSYQAQDGSGIWRQKEEDDIFKMYDLEVKPQLEALGLATQIDSNQMRRHYRTNRGIIPFTYLKEVSFDQLAKVAEQSRFLDGVTFSKRPLRKYPYGSMLCHVLGYVKQRGEMEIPADDPEGKEFDAYEYEDVGVAGVEQTMDKSLRGRPGRRFYPKDEHGKIVYEEILDKRVEPVKGDDLYLTIDARFQYISEMALREAKVGRGAAVVMDPNTGEVLAMASVPDFDPNKFIPAIDIDDWNVYAEDDTTPMMNRALSAYPPGSTFKVPVALAGAVAGVSDKYFTCPGSIAIGSRSFKCWIADKGGAHGTLGMSDALMHSCNCYFYRLGMATGIKTIDQVTHWFGLGEPTGIDLPQEAAGRVPNPKYVALTSGGNWTDAATANTSIGQGAVEASPLQMCVVAATVANGGQCYKPKLVLKTHDHRENVDTAFPDRPRYNLIEKGAKKASVDLVRKGMWKVVNGARGTAKAAKSEGYETAGKTGTAQAWRSNPDPKATGKARSIGDNKTWFITFAPYDEPKLAVCVFVENGKGGGVTSAPIAARIIKQCMATMAGSYHPPLQPLADAKGNFDAVDVVSYADDPVKEQSGEEEAITEADEPDRPAPKRKVQVAQPKLKSRPNAEGSNVRNREAPKPPQPPKKGLFRRLFNRGED